MHLAERRGGEGLVLDVPERFLGRRAELLDEHLAHLRPRHGRDLRLDDGQHLERLGREEVGAHAEHLRELEERAAQLGRARDQALRVPDRRHIGIRHQEHGVRRIQSRDNARVDHVAGVDDDEVVRLREHSEQLLDGARVLRVRPVELFGAGENVEPGLVPRHQLAQELAVQAVQVLDGVEHGEARADAEEQRHLAETRLEVDDRRRLLGDPRQLHGAVDRDGRRPGASLGAEEDVRDAWLARAGVDGVAPGGGLAHRALE